MTKCANAIEFLCRNGGNVSFKDELGMTPLHWCVKTANIAAAKHLLLYAVDANDLDNSGRTPLYLLGIDGSPVPEIGELLIQYGGNLNGKLLPPLSGRPKQAQQAVRTLISNYMLG